MVKKENIKEDILSYKIDNFPADECADQLFQSLLKGRRTWLSCFNPHSYVLSLSDEIFSRALRSADWLIPDGVGIVLASRMLGGSIKERVTGSDVFTGLNELMNRAGSMSVFFLGSTKETLEKIRQRMSRDYPDIKIAGAYSPPYKDIFSSEDINEMVKEINSAAPDVLWVGLTAPKQEKFIFENYAGLNVKFIGAVGAVFDFYSGNVKRNPDSWFISHWLEWLPRLLQEPKRLWRRMFVSAPIFLRHMFREMAKRRNS